MNTSYQPNIQCVLSDFSLLSIFIVGEGKSLTGQAVYGCFYFILFHTILLLLYYIIQKRSIWISFNLSFTNLVFWAHLDYKIENWKMPNYDEIDYQLVFQEMFYTLLFNHNTIQKLWIKDKKMEKKCKNLIDLDCDCVLNTEGLLIAKACQLLQVLKSIFPNN